MQNALKGDRITVIVLETAMDAGVPSYETWWDVPICDVSQRESIQLAREKYDRCRHEERAFLKSS
jgi:3D-(3,5/4)-trihydroxycyclohexane-1,2-dione acylhydrolase (decyclizing)